MAQEASGGLRWFPGLRQGLQPVPPLSSPLQIPKQKLAITDQLSGLPTPLLSVPTSCVKQGNVNIPLSKQLSAQSRLTLILLCHLLQCLAGNANLGLAIMMKNARAESNRLHLTSWLVPSVSGWQNSL